MTHTLKKNRDEFSEAKRTNAETAIMKELKAIRNVTRETFRLAKRNQYEILELNKRFVALAAHLDKDAISAIMSSITLSPIPEGVLLEEELEAIEARDEAQNQHEDAILDLSEPELVIDEDQIEKDLYGELSVEKVIPLTEEQENSKKRRLRIEKEVQDHDFHGMSGGGYSYEEYVSLQDRIQANFSEQTICAPSNPALFQKRYGKPWRSNMTSLADFAGSRANTKIQKPKGWKEKVAEERKNKPGPSRIPPMMKELKARRITRLSGKTNLPMQFNSITDKLCKKETDCYCSDDDTSLGSFSLASRGSANSVNSAVSRGSVKSVTSRNSAKSVTSRGSTSSLDDFQIDRAAWETGNFPSRDARKRRLDAALGLQSDDHGRSSKRPKLKGSAGQLIKNKSKKSYQN